MKKIFLLPIILMSIIMSAQTARVQFIHNSPDELTEAIDLYFGNQKILDSMLFRSASSYLDVNANTNLIVAVQSPQLPDTSASLFRDTLQFDADSTYIVVISGLISSTPYDSLKPFELAVHKSREIATTSGKTDVILYNGSPDAPPLVINEITQSLGAIVTDLNYGEFSDYVELDPVDHILDVVNAREQDLMATYLAPLDSWSLADSAMVILVSGFVDTVQNLPGDTLSAVDAPLFGLWAALPGGGPMMELPVISGLELEEQLTALAQVYPVPADNHLTILKSGKMTGAIEVSIVNLNGQAVFSTDVLDPFDQQYRLDVSHLDSGFYILMMENESGPVFSRKILIR